MKTFIKLGIVGLLMSVCCLHWYCWRKDEPRRASLATLVHFQQSLVSNDNRCLVQVVLPLALARLSVAEQADFVRKALRDEITAGGISLLKRDGEFGRLKAIFPDEAEKWAATAGINPDECVAFKMQQGTVRSEVVLFHEGNRWRIVRCNNVKQIGG